MKSITFRPLRRIKKTGRIVVANYRQWYGIMTADYNKFNLIIDNEYKLLPQNEFVYNHKGELLFFFKINPADIPIFTYSRLLDFDKIREQYRWYGTIWEPGRHATFLGSGIDCYGTPTFSHYTMDYVSDFKDVDQFEPLTVATVVKWFGWFLLNLNNSYLQFGK